LSILELVLQRIVMVAKERQNARVHQDLPLAELEHRVENTLAKIQSVVRNTIQSSGSIEAFMLGLEKRIAAMAHVHSLLSRSRWLGARMQDIVVEELAPHRSGDGTGNVRISGPNLALKAKAALALSLAIHELAANAAKYGALSIVPSERVDVEGVWAARRRTAWSA
jgi:two-component system, chemotaxis family, sensor kinase Cph1